jgi:hypothetical protein
MRTLLAAFVAAVALAVPSVPAHADSVGAGAVVVPAYEFFRPTIGVAGAGTCVYAEAALAATGVAVAVPGGVATVEVSCSVQNANGVPLLTAYAPRATAITAGVGTGRVFDTPVRVCGTVTVDSASWGPVTRSSCAAVLPGNVNT